MNRLFTDEKFRKVLVETNIKLIKKASFESKESFQLEDVLLSNLDKYIDDIIDYLNNSDIDKLIFKKDIKFLNLEYDEIDKKYVLLGKNNNVICKLHIVGLEWIYKNLYLEYADSQYGGSIYITYEAHRFQNKQCYKIKQLNNQAKIIIKMLKDYFSISAFITMNFFLFYKDAKELSFDLFISNDIQKIYFNNNKSDKFKLLFEIIGEDIKKRFNIQNLKELKVLIKKLKNKNSYLSSLLRNNTFKSISFDNYNNKESKFLPFVKFEEEDNRFIVYLKDFDNVLNNDLYLITGDERFIYFSKHHFNNVYKLTEFKLMDYVKNKNEVLDYIKLQNY